MRWKPYQVIVFDCDSTLSAVEGIDELADWADESTANAVAALTSEAMDGAAPLEDVYGQRLAMLDPTQDEVRALRNRYKDEVVPDAREVVGAFTAANTENWIVSGGLYEPVAEFGTWLGFDPSRVRAVSTEFDPLNGRWWEPGGAERRYVDYQRGDLTTSTGKAAVIEQAVTNPGRKMLVGDGVSDLMASPAVDLFVAYAGVVARPAVTEQATVVINSASLSPLLALGLGRSRVKEFVGTEHDAVARRALDSFETEAVRFNDADVAEAFAAS